MRYIVYYMLNDNRAEDWTVHSSLLSAINQAYYWLHHGRLDRCEIYRIENKRTLTEIAELHNV